MRRIIMLALVATGAVASLAPGGAWAAFTQATCTSSSFSTPVPTEIGALEYVKLSTSPAGGSGDMTLYNLNTHANWPIVMNPNVSGLKPSFGHFVTELNFDKLRISGDNGQTFTYMGTLNSGTTLVQSSDVWSPVTVPAGYKYVSQDWVSDVSVVPDIPPTIGQVSVKCKSVQTTTAVNGLQILQQQRQDGLMLKSGDTIYAHTVQSANHTMIITLDALATTANADFDLYVSTSTTTPDDSNFTWRGFSGSASEALLIPATGSDRTLNIGVHSFSGAGHYALSVDHTTAPTQNFCLTDSTLTQKLTPTPAEQSQITAFFKAGATTFFGFTDGLAWRGNFNFNKTWTGTCDFNNSGCDICLVNDGGGVSFGGTTASMLGHIEMHGGNWSQGAVMGWLFAHEAGHASFGLADQYQLPPAGDASPRFCGHTSMANSSKALAFCSMFHCFDGQVAGPECDPSSQSDWDRIGISAWSPDLFTFGKSITAYPTPHWNNTNLANLVSITNFP